jgi:hypothetical protein
MTTLLSTHGRKLALELGRAIDDGDSRRVVELVASWGITEKERRQVAESLAAPSGDDVSFGYDRWDGAHVRDLQRVWSQGLRSGSSAI